MTELNQTQIQSWRRKAARNLADRIAKIGGDLNSIDLAVDDLIRQLNNQPPRPSDRKAYEGIFRVDKIDIQLNVPFYPQTDDYTQPERTCNSSSCAMVAKFLGAGILRDDEYLQRVLAYGNTADHAVQTKVLAEYGIESTWRTDLDFDDLDASLEKGMPIVIAILHRGSESAPTGEHVIVVTGRYGISYCVNDPYGTLNDGYTSDVSNGKGAIYSRSLLRARWLVGGKCGWGRIFQPKVDFVKGD